MTIKKKESEAKGRDENAKRSKEVLLLQGKEKLEYEIGLIKSQIKNVEGDLKKMKNNSMVRNKLTILKNQLNEKNNIMRKYMK